MVVAWLAWWQRRGNSKATYWETFMGMHQPGMQPYFTRLGEILGKPAKRSFETAVRPASQSDSSCALAMGFSGKHLVISFTFELAAIMVQSQEIATFRSST